MKDLVITWPKKRKLDSYLDELAKAWLSGEVINFRVPTLPKSEIDRCYIVHDGSIRGYNEIISVEWRSSGQVLDPITGAFWPAGNYIVRDPEWHEIEPIPMKGFQGYRYIDRPQPVPPNGCWEEE